MPKAGTNGTPGQRKYRNVTMDAEVHEALVTEQDRLRRQWGFRPSLSQVVRHLLFAVPPAPRKGFDDGPTAA